MVRLLLSGGLLFAVQLTIGHAQVKTVLKPDASLPRVTEVKQLMAPREHTYVIRGGTRWNNGPNLFHSFERFQVGMGDTARFQSPAGIKNILSRVTGEQASVIDGVLQSRKPGVNVYLLNPSGVVFRSHATLDVKGSFHVSTADALRFADGATFSAHLGGQSTFTVVEPSAFGFLSQNPQGIAMRGSPEKPLTVPTNKTLSVVGGEIKIVGGALEAPSGRIHLVSVVSRGDVPLHTPQQSQAFDVPSLARLGKITIGDLSRIDVTGFGTSGGTVVIRGGHLRMAEASEIAARALGGDQGGDITVQVNRLTLTAGARISTSGRARGGTVSITAPDAVIIRGESTTNDVRSGIFSTSFEKAGTILLNVGRLALEEGGLISVFANVLRGGHIRITARDAVNITGSAQSGAASGLYGESIDLTEPAVGGTIVVHAPTITLSRGATITTQTDGTGKAGSIRLFGADAIRFREQSRLTTEARGASGGNIVVRAGSLVEIWEQSVITAEVQGQEQRGGNIDIGAKVVLAKHSDIRANAPQGQGGRITIGEAFLADAYSRSHVNASGGVTAGVVEIQRVIDLSGISVPLSQTYASAAALLHDPCSVRLQEGMVSSLVVRERDGIPPTLEGILPSRLYRGSETTTRSARHERHRQDPPSARQERHGSNTTKPLQERWRHPLSTAQGTRDAGCLPLLLAPR
jgi:filamentous hemagglutinin family protein